MGWQEDKKGWEKGKEDTKRTFTSGLSEIVEGEKGHLPEREKEERDIESQGEVVLELFSRMEELFEKEITEKDALNRIRWDPRLNPGDFSIHYLDLGKLKEINFSEIELQGDFFRIGESLVPMHRIRKISWKGRVVWDKRSV